MVRDNKKAFTEIPVKVLPGHQGTGVSRPFLTDTVFQQHPDSVVRWFVNSGGDCQAKFYFKLFTDNRYPVVVLKEYTISGNCRAGGYWDFTLLFNKPPGFHYFLKNRLREN
jgi:hypothetical protein